MLESSISSLLGSSDSSLSLSLLLLLLTGFFAFLDDPLLFITFYATFVFFDLDLGGVTFFEGYLRVFAFNDLFLSGFTAFLLSCLESEIN